MVPAPSLRVWSVVILLLVAAGIGSAAQIGSGMGENTSTNPEMANQAIQQSGSSIRFGNQQSDGETVTIRTVTVPEGGFIVVHEDRATGATSPSASPSPAAPATTIGRRSPATTAGSRTPEQVSIVPVDTESIIGVSEYLEPGTHRDVTITLFDVPRKDFDRTQLTESQNVASAELHRDTNDNERFDFLTSGRSADAPYYAPYIVSGDTVIEKGPVIDVAVVAVGETIREAKGIGPTPTGTAMAAGAGGAEPTREATAVRTQANAGAPIRTANTEESGGSGPGFGALVAIIAILSALVLAWRV